MNDVNRWRSEANELCEKALRDAKAELHPLLRSADVDQLDQRDEFRDAFRSALETRVAKRIAIWLPEVQSVFRFDESLGSRDPSWDGRIHLLLKVPRLMKRVQAIAKSLDAGLLKHLKRLGWSRIQKQRSILDIQQVTVNELRHGIGYAAMFHAVYSTPEKIWPSL